MSDTEQASSEGRLKKAYFDFFQRALVSLRAQRELLGDRIAQRQFCLPVDVKITDSDTSFGVRVSSQRHIVPDWIWFTIRMGETLVNGPECRAAMDALRIFVDTSKFAGVEHAYFLTPLAHLVKAHNGLEIDESAIQRKIEELVASIRTGNYSLEVTAVLSGFYADTSKIELDDCCILKPDDDEIRRCWDEDGEFSLQGNSIIPADFLLRTSGPAHVEQGGVEFHALHAKLKRVLFVLRLFKNGKIHINAPKGRQLSWAPIAEPGQRLQRSFEIRRYRLKQDEVPRLLECWRRHAKLLDTNDPRVRLGIERFGQTFDRDIPQDAIIDAFIGLEALLIEDDRELSYKLRLRMANLIGTDGAERLKVFEDMKAGYDLRSKIVHGKQPPKVRLPSQSRDVSLAEFADEMVRYLAKALMKASDFQSQVPDGKLISYLDSLALRASH